MKKILPTVSLFCFLLTSAFAQNKTSIKSVSAYFTVSIPGMQRVDENGNRINPTPFVNRFMYVEVKGNTIPFFDTISYNGIMYKSTVVADNNTVKVGINVLDGVPINLKAQKGNKLWRIELQLINAQAKVTPKATQIVLKGKVDKLPFKLTVTKEIELSSPEMY